MSWIIFSLLPPLLWAITNHTDKFMLTRYLKDKGGASLMILTSFSAGLILPFIAIFGHQLIPMPLLHILILLFAGSIIVINYICYIFAMAGEEASIVIPLYQSIPVFSYILGYVFLGEKLNAVQILAGLIIIFGSILITIDLNASKFKIKQKPLWLMFSASFLAALTGLLFKYVALKESYWGSQFWLYLGMVLGALIVLALVKTWRQELVEILSKDRAAIIGLNIFNETLNVGAGLIYSYATLIAPLALVAVLSNGFQPVFVLIIAIILSLLIPKLGKEELSRKQLAQKIISIIIIFVGTYLLNR